MGKPMHSQSPVFYQRGVAAIWMAMLLVPIMGFVILAVEGTRYIQEKSRIEDAAEAAAFALTLEDNTEAASTMAKAYVRAYVRDIVSLDVAVIRDVQPFNAERQIARRVQYTVLATTVHQSWFNSDVIPSFSEKQTLIGRSEAIKSVP